MEASNDDPHQVNNTATAEEVAPVATNGNATVTATPVAPAATESNPPATETAAPVANESNTPAPEPTTSITPEEAVVPQQPVATPTPAAAEVASGTASSSATGPGTATSTNANESLLQRIAALKERIATRKAHLQGLEATLAAAVEKNTNAEAGGGSTLQLLDSEGFTLVPPELLKTTMQQHQQASKDVADLDRAKAKTKPEYDLVLKNAHVRDEHSRMQSEAADKEEGVAAAEEASIALEAQLGDASRKYKAEVKKRDQYLQQVMAAISDLQFTVQRKLILTTTVDPTDEVYYPPTEATSSNNNNADAVGSSDQADDLNEASSRSRGDSRAPTPMHGDASHLSVASTPDNKSKNVVSKKNNNSAAPELVPEYIRKALPRPAEEEYSPIIADDTIELIADAVRTRDRQISSLLKLKREHESMRRLNAEKLAGMRGEGAEAAEELMRQKDEAIRAAVYQFQSERNKLHVDIEDMRKINKEQGEALKNGQRRVAPEKGGFGRKVQDNSVKAAAKEKLKLRIDDLRNTVEDLQEEMNRLQIAIRDGTKTKAQLLRDDKLLDIRIKRDAENQRLALANLDGEIDGANLGVSRTEKECDKISLMVKSLSEQVKFLKEESDANHGARTKPLPE